MRDPNPNEPTETLNPARELLGVRLTSAGYVIDYIAGPSNSDGFASGTVYTITQASAPTKIG